MGCTQAKAMLPGGGSVDLSGPVDLKHFDVQRVIGEGGFGKVKAVLKKKETPVRWYAMKVLQKVTVVEKRCVSEVFQERDLLTYLRHDRICNLFYSFQDKRHCYLVMDIALGGDLRYQLNHNADGKAFGETRARIYCAQIMLALKYVHSRGIIHRDLKPENVLVQADGWLKLTDFGISQKVDSENYCYSGSGTAGYMAPELYTLSHRHSFQADWFAFGVTMHELLVKRRPVNSEDIIAAGRKLPYQGQRRKDRALESRHNGKAEVAAAAEGDSESSNADTKNKNNNGSSPSLTSSRAARTGSNARFSLSSRNFVSKVSKECSDLLAGLLKVVPEDRLGADSAADIEAHPWFAKSDDFDMDAVEDRTHPVPFVPDLSKMNAEPDADIRAVFIGGEEERQLRNLTPEEQILFDGYEYDYYASKENGTLVEELPQRPQSLSEVASEDGVQPALASPKSHAAPPAEAGKQPVQPPVVAEAVSQA